MVSLIGFRNITHALGFMLNVKTTRLKLQILS